MGSEVFVAFLIGALATFVAFIFWPENESSRYLRGVLDALHDAKHCDSELALDFYRDIFIPRKGDEAYNQGYLSTLRDLSLSFKVSGRLTPPPQP